MRAEAIFLRQSWRSVRSDTVENIFTQLAIRFLDSRSVAAITIRTMLKLCLIASSFLSPIAYANALDLSELVARDIQGLLNDTVNEGDQTAHVIYEAGKAQVSCRLSPVKGSANEQWAFCKVGFEVRYEDQEETRSCGLLYRAKGEGAGLSLERTGDSFSDCIESLGESL